MLLFLFAVYVVPLSVFFMLLVFSIYFQLRRLASRAAENNVCRGALVLVFDVVVICVVHCCVCSST